MSKWLVRLALIPLLCLAALAARADDLTEDDVMAKNHELAHNLNISGTPTFIVGDSVLRGAYPQADIQKAIDENS